MERKKQQLCRANCNSVYDINDDKMGKTQKDRCRGTDRDRKTDRETEYFINTYGKLRHDSSHVTQRCYRTKS